MLISSRLLLAVLTFDISKILHHISSSWPRRPSQLGLLPAVLHAWISLASWVSSFHRPLAVRAQWLPILDCEDHLSLG